MKLTLEPDHLSLEFTEDLFVEFHCEWLQIFGKFNWYSFHVIHLYFENDAWAGGFEFTMYLLGFGVRLRWNYDPSKLEDIKRKADD